MKTRLLVFIACMSILISACSNTAPGCSDKETKKLVIDIAKGELIKGGATKDELNSQSLKILSRHQDNISYSS